MKVETKEQLRPCPFCGDIPELPEGIGTQYEIYCDCGMAMSSVQICDLMTIDERTSDCYNDKTHCYNQEFVNRAKEQAIKNWNKRLETED